MAPSPSHQPAALRSVAMDCDPPAQCATTRASSLRGCFRGDGALAIVSACRPPFGRNGLRPSRAMCDDEGVVATGVLSWRWRPRHRISLPPFVRSQQVATLPRNVRRRGRRRYGCAFVAMAPRHRIRLPPSVRSQWIATLPRNVRRRGHRRYEIQQMAKCNRKS